MSGAEVENVIELICDKIGIVVDSVADAVPLFATHGLITNGIPMLLCLIYIVGTAIFLFILVRTCLNVSRRGDMLSDDDSICGLIVIGIILAIVGMFVAWNFFVFVEGFLGWMMAPQAEMVYEILRML